MKNQRNPVIDEHRLIKFKNRSRNGKIYYMFILIKDGYRAQITLNEDDSLLSPPPSHSHPALAIETHVHTMKQNLKRKVAESDLPTIYLVTKAVGGLSFETRAKLNCDLNAMHKMARYSRAAVQQHPTNPTTLEDLVLPAPYITATSGEPLLLWDLGYITQHRQSFLFCTPQNTSVLQDADHFIIDGTFKTSPNLMTQMVTVHGHLNSKGHFPLVINCYWEGYLEIDYVTVLLNMIMTNLYDLFLLNNDKKFNLKLDKFILNLLSRNSVYCFGIQCTNFPN